MQRSLFLVVAFAFAQIIDTSNAQNEVSQNQALDPVLAFHPPMAGCVIARHGLSPDGQTALIVAPGHLFPNGQASLGFSCVITHAHPDKYLDLGDVGTSSVEDRATAGSFGSVLKWANNSSALLLFGTVNHDNENGGWAGIAWGAFGRAAFGIRVVPIVNGVPGKPYDLGVEILKASHPDFVKSHAEDNWMKTNPSMYILINDKGLDDDLTFNDSNQIVIDCMCENGLPNDMYREIRGNFKHWAVHVVGLWDPILCKFIKVSFTPVDSPTPKGVMK